MFFPTDSVTTWLGRGVVWTLAFELLLVALSPFELALWSTHPSRWARARTSRGTKAHVKAPVTPTAPGTPTTGRTGQNQTVQPPADQSGATAQPPT